MIQYIKRKDLDIKKYDACIEASINSRIYAYSWYLDIVADNWDVLVLNDYKAVMPLPFLRAKRFLFFEKIIQPRFCQQLGVFSTIELRKDSFDEFISLLLKLKPLSYNMNSFNSKKIEPNGNNFDERINYELELILSYDKISNSYSKNLKRNIATARKIKLRVSDKVDVEEVIKMKKQVMNHNIKSKSFRVLSELMKEVLLRKAGISYGVYLDNEIIGSAFFLSLNNRIIHLFSSCTEVGKINGAIPYLFDSIIRGNESKDLVFDFEGSMIPGVQRFFKSFGAKQSNFYQFKG